MELEPWMADLKPEELPSPYREIAEKVNLASALVLATEFGGLTHYFAKVDRILVPIRNRKIREAFDGTNYRALAIRFRLTESQVRNIIDDAVDDRQLNMLE